MASRAPNFVVGRRRRMATDAKSRVRQRIRARLDELGMTGRELAQANPGGPKSDGWISGVLNGAQGLQLEDLDWVADKLRMNPSELVRLDSSELRELKPHEMRLLRHYQQLPEQIQERILRVLDYYSATVPDPEGARLVEHYKELSQPDRRILRNFVDKLLRGTLPPDDEPSGGGQGSGAA